MPAQRAVKGRSVENAPQITSHRKGSDLFDLDGAGSDDDSGRNNARLLGGEKDLAQVSRYAANFVTNVASKALLSSRMRAQRTRRRGVTTAKSQLPTHRTVLAQLDEKGEASIDLARFAVVKRNRLGLPLPYQFKPLRQLRHERRIHFTPRYLRQVTRAAAVHGERLRLLCNPGQRQKVRQRRVAKRVNLTMQLRVATDNLVKKGALPKTRKNSNSDHLYARMLQ